MTVANGSVLLTICLILVNISCFIIIVKYTKIRCRSGNSFENITSQSTIFLLFLIVCLRCVSATDAPSILTFTGIICFHLVGSCDVPAVLYIYFHQSAFKSSVPHGPILVFAGVASQSIVSLVMLNDCLNVK
jgi:hypothetical protein